MPSLNPEKPATRQLELAIGQILRDYGLQSTESTGRPLVNKEMASVARSNRLDGFLFAHSERLGIDADAMAALSAQSKKNALDRMGHSTEMLRVARALEESGIEHAFFKGAVLAEQLGERGKGRTVGDVDVLVRPEDVRKTIHILQSSGYMPRFQMKARSRLGWALILFRARELPLRQASVELDLHWRIGSEPDLCEPTETLLARRTSIPLAGRNIHTLQATDSLVMLAIQIMQDRSKNLRHIVDFAVLAGQVDPEETPITNPRSQALIADVARLAELIFGILPTLEPWRSIGVEKHSRYLFRLYRGWTDNNRQGGVGTHSAFSRLWSPYRHLSRYSNKSRLMLRLITRAAFFFPETTSTQQQGGLVRAHLHQWRRVLQGQYDSGI